LCEVVNSDILYIVSVIATGMVHMKITQLQFFAVCFNVSVSGVYLFCISHTRLYQIKKGKVISLQARCGPEGG